MQNNKIHGKEITGVQIKVIIESGNYLNSQTVNVWIKRWWPNRIEKWNKKRPTELFSLKTELRRRKYDAATLGLHTNATTCSQLSILRNPAVYSIAINSVIKTLAQEIQ